MLNSLDKIRDNKVDEARLLWKDGILKKRASAMDWYGSLPDIFETANEPKLFEITMN